MKASIDTPKLSRGKKLLFIGLGALATGLLSYFGLRYWRKNKQDNPNQDEAPRPVKNEPVNEHSTAAKPGSKKPGSAKHSKAKPKATAPNGGSYSSAGKTNATKPSSSNGPLDVNQVAADLDEAISKKDFARTQTLLNKIKTSSDYLRVSQKYQVMPGSKGKSLVTGLRTTFKTSTQSRWLVKTFLSMGLKFNGKTWSLSGTAHVPLLITTEATKVWKDPKTFVQVPVNMVLGKELAKRGAFSLFENDKTFFLVETKSVNYYNH